jgi:ABC-type Zn uptake system ZnuABC Zn-binding protein ZnuA
MFISSLLAGSVVPFSSEVIMAGLLLMGLSPIGVLISGTLGNTLGGMSCYYIGRLGKEEWMERYFHVKRERMERMQTFLQGKGAVMAFFAFLPGLGEVISMALGYMRSNQFITTLSMLIGKLLRYIVILFAMSAFTSCGHHRATTEADTPTLTVTIEPLRYFTETIAGSRFQVISMVPKGNSPETYDPTPQQLVALHKSKAYLRIGYIGFEQVWMEKLKENAPGLTVFDTSRDITLIADSIHAHADHTHAEGVEPHIWNSARNAAIIAANIKEALITLDPAHRTEYEARTDSLLHIFHQTDSVIGSLLAPPDADRAFMIYHPALSYFARDYGLHQISIEEGGKEPSPAQLQQLINRCHREQVHVIFVQPEFDRRNAEAIARQTGTRIVPVTPLSYDWQQEMLHTAQALASPDSKQNK